MKLTPDCCDDANETVIHSFIHFGFICLNNSTLHDIKHGGSLHCRHNIHNSEAKHFKMCLVCIQIVNHWNLLKYGRPCNASND